MGPWNWSLPRTVSISAEISLRYFLKKAPDLYRLTRNMKSIFDFPKRAQPVLQNKIGYLAFAIVT